MPLHSTKSSTAIPTRSNQDSPTGFEDEDEDFNNDWGGFGDDDGVSGNTNAKALEEEEDPWGTPAVSKPTSTTSYDDKGEPDFAGWLAAQSGAKKTTKNPLPKGLAKSSVSTMPPSTKPARPVGVRASTTGSTTVTRKVVAAPKKEAPKEKEDEEEGWGDAW
jgi:SCY1-like protein 1